MFWRQDRLSRDALRLMNEAAKGFAEWERQQAERRANGIVKARQLALPFAAVAANDKARNER